MKYASRREKTFNALKKFLTSIIEHLIDPDQNEKVKFFLLEYLPIST